MVAPRLKRCRGSRAKLDEDTAARPFPPGVSPGTGLRRSGVPTPAARVVAEEEEWYQPVAAQGTIGKNATGVSDRERRPGGESHRAPAAPAATTAATTYIGTGAPAAGSSGATAAHEGRTVES